MPVTVRKIELWNAVVDNQPGALAAVLEPLAAVGADLEIVMGTAIPGAAGKASVGVFPVKGRKVLAAARAAGLAPASSMPALLVTGDNRAGLGGRMSESIAAAGIDIGVAVAQVVGGHFSALFGFASAADANKAAALLKKAANATAKATPAPKAKATPAAGKKAAVTRRGQGAAARRR